MNKLREDCDNMVIENSSKQQALESIEIEKAAQSLKLTASKKNKDS